MQVKLHLVVAHPKVTIRGEEALPEIFVSAHRSPEEAFQSAQQAAQMLLERRAEEVARGGSGLRYVAETVELPLEINVGFGLLLELVRALRGIASLAGALRAIRALAKPGGTGGLAAVEVQQGGGLRTQPRRGPAAAL